jgi:predicted amidohydrolase YtcJ
MSLAGAGIAGVVTGPWIGAAAAAEGQDADLVVVNAKVYTVDSRMPRAEAFAIKAGRFAAVGSTADIKSLIGKGTQTLDAK